MLKADLLHHSITGRRADWFFIQINRKSNSMKI